jgi:hypothetical protein
MKLFIKCDDANHTCDKTQYNEASFWEKIKLNIHLIYCTACRKYTARNTKLTQVVNEGKPELLSKDQKEKIKETLLRELSKEI